MKKSFLLVADEVLFQKFREFCRAKGSRPTTELRRFMQLVTGYEEN